MGFKLEENFAHHKTRESYSEPKGGHLRKSENSIIMNNTSLRPKNFFV